MWGALLSQREAPKPTQAPRPNEMDQPGSLPSWAEQSCKMLVRKGIYHLMLWFFYWRGRREGEVQVSRKVVMSSWEIMFNKHMDREKGVRDGKQGISFWDIYLRLCM